MTKELKDLIVAELECDIPNKIDNANFKMEYKDLTTRKRNCFGEVVNEDINNFEHGRITIEW